MKYKPSADAIMSCVFIMLCAVLFFWWPTGYERSSGRKGEMYLEKGRITDIDNSEVRTNLIVKTGWQKLNCRLVSGPHTGKLVTVMNQLTGKMELDEIYEKGRTILVHYRFRDGEVISAVARGHYRLGLQLLLVLLFAGLLLITAGWTGFKALLSFLFSALMIWKVMLPMFLRGYNPVVTALSVVAVLTGAISFLVGGLSRKGLTTFLGALLGLLLTCGLALLFSRGFHVHGAVRPFAETLLYSGFADLKLTSIFQAAVFVAASGAVMDLAMDIAAAMEEIKEKHPGISCAEHIRSGLRVGRSVIGTMTTTLLLAYSGSYITMLMLFIGQGLPVPIVLNLNYVAAEVLNTLVGSFGLVTVAPFTALTGGLIYSRALRRKRGRDTESR